VAVPPLPGRLRTVDGEINGGDVAALRGGTATVSRGGCAGRGGCPGRGGGWRRWRKSRRWREWRQIETLSESVEGLSPLRHRERWSRAQVRPDLSRNLTPCLLRGM
jgi:hypothetical protein